MPAHLTPYLIMLPLLGWVVWRRVHSQFGPQPIRRKRMIIRIAVFALIGGMLALASLHHLALAEGLAGGILIGGFIGVVGLRLTRFEVDPVKGECYVPNPWMGALLTALLLVRLGWHVLEAWRGSASGLALASAGAEAMQPMARLPSALTWLVIGLLVGYYLIYFTGLLIHHRRFQRTHRAAASTW